MTHSEDARPVDTRRSPRLRRDLSVVATDADGCIVVDGGAHVRFEGLAADRALLGLLDGRLGEDELADALRGRSDRALSKHAVRSRLKRFAAAGLLESSSPADSGSATLADTTVSSFLLAHWVRFIGVATHPLALVPLAALTWMGLSALIDRSDLLWHELGLWLLYPPPAPLVVGSYLQTLILENLPRALIEGALCARVGSTFKGVRLHFVGGILPFFVADIRGTARLASTRERWTLLLSSVLYQLGLCMFAAVAWHQCRAHSLPGGFWLLLLPPTAIMVVLRLNPFAPQVGAAALAALVRYPQLYVRGRQETRAWLGFGTDHPAATRRQRFWLRVYGLLSYGWSFVLEVGSIILVGWWLTARWAGAGALLGITLLVIHFKTPLRRIVMSNPVSRAMARYEDRAWFRWGVRLAIIAIVVLIGFIPYDYEVGGDMRLVPRAEHGVRAQISGEIESMNVTQGQQVGAGSVIATLAARDQRAAVETTTAELQRAQAQLDLLEAGAAKEEIAKAAAELEQKKAERDFAITELTRTEALKTGGAATQATLDKARRTRDSLDQAVRAAQEHFAHLQGGARPEQVRAAQATVAQLTSELAHDREMLALATLTTPIAGRVATADANVRVGQYVNNGDLVAVIQDTSVLVARIYADQAAAVRIQPGLLTNVRLDGLDGRLVTGHVLRIAPRAENRPVLAADSFRTDRETQAVQNGQQDTDDRYVGVDIALDDPPPALVPEMTGYGRIKIREDVLWRALARPVLRFFRVEVWSWLP